MDAGGFELGVPGYGPFPEWLPGGTHVSVGRPRHEAARELLAVVVAHSVLGILPAPRLEELAEWTGWPVRKVVFALVLLLAEGLIVQSNALDGTRVWDVPPVDAADTADGIALVLECAQYDHRAAAKKRMSGLGASG